MPTGEVDMLRQRMSFDQRQKVWLSVTVSAFGLFILIILLLNPIRELISFIVDREAFIEYVSRFGVWGPLILAGFNVLLVVVALLPGHIVILAAGYLYGLLPGFLLNHMSVLLGSLVSFYLARRYGRPIVERLVPVNVLNRLDEAAKGHGFVFFLTCYLLPLFPADVLNFVAGLSPLPLGSFILANLLGRAWITFAITAAGTYSKELIDLDIPPLAWAVFFIVSFMIYRIWQSHYFKAGAFRRERRQPEAKPGKSTDPDLAS